MEQPARMKFGAHLSDPMLHMQGTVALHEAGELDDKTYRAYLDYFAAFLATPGGATFWEEFKPTAPPQLDAAVTSRLAKGEFADISSMPFFRAE